MFNPNLYPIRASTSGLTPLAFTNQLTVTYTHNLGRYVNYLILDSNDFAIGGQAQETLNAITITFNFAISGTLIIW